MRYSELMLLENDVSLYLANKYMECAEIVSIEESSVDVDISALYKEYKKYPDLYAVVDGEASHAKNTNKSLKKDEGGYNFAKLMNKLSGSITGFGTGAALVGKLSDNKIATALGTAVAISGILSRVTFSKKYIEKQGKKYERSLTRMIDDLDRLKHEIPSAAEDYLQNLEDGDISANVIEGTRHRARGIVKQIDQVQKNINKVRNKLLDENPDMSGSRHRYND